MNNNIYYSNYSDCGNVHNCSLFTRRYDMYTDRNEPSQYYNLPLPNVRVDQRFHSYDYMHNTWYEPDLNRYHPYFGDYDCIQVETPVTNTKVPEEIDLVSDEETSVEQRSNKSHQRVDNLVVINCEENPNITSQNYEVKNSNDFEMHQFLGNKFIAENSEQNVMEKVEVLMDIDENNLDFTNDEFLTEFDARQRQSYFFSADEACKAYESKKNDVPELSTLIKNIPNDFVGKKLNLIPIDFDTPSLNSRTQVNAENKLESADKNPYIKLHKIDGIDKHSIPSHNCILQSTSVKSQVNEAKKIKVSIQISDNELNRYKDLSIQTKKQQHDPVKTTVSFNTFENSNTHAEKFVRDPVKQLKSVLLLINEKLKDNYKVCLYTETYEFDQIYDSLYCFERFNQLTYKVDCNLCMVKYFSWKEYDVTPTINFKMLSSSDFNIEKCYNMYIDSMKMLNNPNKIMNDFTIYTNLELNYSAFENNNIIVRRGCRPNSYKLILDQNNEFYKSLCKKFVKLPALAKTIADHVVNKETVTLKGLIKKYHVALINENVIETKTKMVNGKKRFIGNFKYQFIRGYNLSASARELREKIQVFLGRPISEDMELYLTLNFGKDFSFDENPHVIQIDKLATELVILINTSLQLPTQAVSFRKNSSIASDITKITGHILEKGGNNSVVFTKQFLDYNAKLPGNLDLLRNLISNKLQEKMISFNQLGNCKFKMNEFRDKESNVTKTLPDDNCKISILQFFDKLEFVINTTDVENRICNEIVDEFKFNINLIQGEACAKAVEDEFKMWLNSKNYSINPFDLIKFRISKFIINNQFMTLSNIFEEMNLEFHKECLKQIKYFLSDDNIKFINIKTKYVQAIKQKIRQVLKCIPKYANNESCIFVTYSTLITETSHVLNAFQLPSINLLIIERDEIPQNIFEIISTLKQILDNSQTDKKLLIIGKASSVSKKLNPKMIFDNLKFDLNTLTQESQNALLKNIDVQLHQRKLKLIDIMDSNILSKLITTYEMFIQLTKEKFIIGKELLIPSGFDDDCYIRNQVTQSIIIKSTIFKEKTNDVFVIIGIEKIDFYEFILSNEKVCYLHELDTHTRNVRFILVDHTYHESSFDKFAETKDVNIHLLKYESKRFVWKKSSRSILDLFDYKDNNTDVQLKLNHKSNILTEYDFNNKIVIIAGNTGAGKSQYLYDLARRLSTSRNIWLAQINLTNTTFLPYENTIIKEDFNAIHIITELLGLDMLYKVLFAMSASGTLNLQVAILFDGFDELRPNHIDFMIQLLKHLQSTSVSNIYVTARPNSCVKLEKELRIFSYSLNSFTHNEKIDFLVKYWTKKLKAPEQTNILRECAQNLLLAYNDNHKLSLCPLNLKMIAEIHVQSIKEKTLNTNFTIIHNHDHYELYKHFISISLIEKSINQMSLQKASMKRLLDSKELSALKFNNKKSYINIPEFNHITYAEYFTAHDLVYKSNFEPSAYDCIDRLVVTSSHVFLDTLATLFHLNNKTSLQTFVSFLAQKGYINILKFLIHRNSYDDDSTEKTALHIAAETNNIEMLRILLQNYNDVETVGAYNDNTFYPCNVNPKLSKYVNKVFQSKNALQIAATNDNIQIACNLILAGADVKVVDKKFLKSIVVYILTSTESTLKQKLWPLTEQLLSIVPEIIHELKKEIGFSKLINYYFAHGRIKIIRTLFKVIKKRANIQEFLSEKQNDMTLLDCINNSASLRDEERLELCQLFIEEIGLELMKKKNYLGSILQAAIKYEHVKTFDYFVDQNPGGYIGFLKFALLNNDIKILKFLMRNNERTLDPATGNTALQTAVQLGVSLRLVKFLIDKGGVNNVNHKGENVLTTAIKSGKSIKIIKYLIKQGAYLHIEDKEGLYPWCYAILAETTKYNKYQQLELMQYLLKEAPSKISVPVERCKSYLYDKRRHELAKKFEFFINADLYNVDHAGKGELHLHKAIISNDLVWCNFLIQHGADVNIRDSQGRTALHIAIEYSRHDAAKLLLQNGAMFDATDRSNRSPLSILRDNNHTSEDESQIELCKILERASLLFSGKKLTMLLKNSFPVDKEEVDDNEMRYLIACKDKKGQSLVHVAAQTSSGDALRQLLKFSNVCSERYLDYNRLNVDGQDLEGNAPIHLAARKGYESFITILLNEGAIHEKRNVANATAKNLAEVNKCNNVCVLLDKVNTLFKNVLESNFKIIKRCLAEEPLLINSKDISGRNVLHWAVTLNDDYITNYLIRNRIIKISAEDLSGRTPLHYAVEADNLKIVIALIKAGAMIDAQDKKGCRPFDIPKNNKCVELVRVIHRLFRDVESDEPKIILNEQPQILIDYLIKGEYLFGVKRDVIINARDCERNSLMHYCAKFNLNNIIVTLLKHGAVYNPRNKLKQTPYDLTENTKELLRAIDGMFTNVSVDLWQSNCLVDHEIAIKCRGIGGYTLLHVAVKNKKIEEIKWLMEHGAIVDVSNNKDSSILSHADKTSPQIAKLLRGKPS